MGNGSTKNKPESIREAEAGIVYKDDEGRVLGRVGLSGTVYFYDGYTQEKRSALARCIAYYKEQCGEMLRWEIMPPSERRIRLLPAGDARLPDWGEYLAALDPNVAFEYHAHSGDEQDEAAFYSLEILTTPKWEQELRNHLSYLKFTVPWSWVEERPGEFERLLESFADWLGAEHGYGGLGFILSLGIPERAAPWAYMLSRRFLCIDVSHPTGDTLNLQEHVKGASWIVLLSEWFVERLGGEARVREVLSDPHFRFRHYSRGLVIQVGEEPTPCPAEEGVPEAYLQLNELLCPLRSEKVSVFGWEANPNLPGEVFDLKEVNRWWRERLDRERLEAAEGPVR